MNRLTVVSDHLFPEAIASGLIEGLYLCGPRLPPDHFPEAIASGLIEGTPADHVDDEVAVIFPEAIASGLIEGPLW